MKYAIKTIKQGQTQKVNIVSQGAGLSGEAVVIPASEGARYHIADIVTYVSPDRLHAIRAGDDLHLALPEGDPAMPDVILKDYFSVEGASVQGLNARGEWTAYDTARLASSEAAGAVGETSASGATLGAVRLSTPGQDWISFFDSPMGMGALVGGGIVASEGVRAIGKDGGGGTGSTTPTEPLGIMQAYTSDSATTKTATAPKLADYTTLGIKAYGSLTDTSEAGRVALSASGISAAALESALNSAIDKLEAGQLTKEKIQAIEDAYYRILKEADGDANVNTDVYNDTVNDAANASLYNDPTAADYAAIGATVGSGKSLELLNNVLGRLSVGKVDTVDEINTLARAAENVVQAAKDNPTANATGPALFTTNAEWVSGLVALGITGVTESMVTDIKDVIKKTADDGSEVDTFDKLNTVLKPVIAIQALRNYALSSGNTPPDLPTFKAAGIFALTNLNADTASAPIDDSSVTGALGISSDAWLSTLRSGLDKLDLTSKTAMADIKTAVQNMVNSYYRILSEADGVVNTTTDVDVYPGDANSSDPTATDYTNIGATVGNSKSVDLLNDIVGQSTKTAVDTVDEINALAKAAYNVMVQAGVAPVAAGTAVPALYATDSVSSADQKWVDGLTLLGVSGVTLANIAAVKQKIADSADTGGQVDTLEEIKSLLKTVIAEQALKDYAATTNGAGVTAPTLADYSNYGIKTFKSLTDTSDASRKELGDGSTANGADSNTFLTAAILNSALDTKAASDVTKDNIQKMADSYYRILREADGRYLGDSNGGAAYYDGSAPAKTADTDVYADTTNDSVNASAFNDPTLADYANIGVTVDDAISTTAYSGTTGQGNESLDLLNDAIGRLTTSAVDTVDEIKALATTANDVMRLAKGDTATQADAKLIDGLNALLGLTAASGVNTGNLAALKNAIAASLDNGTDVVTTDQLLSVLALVRLQAFTDDSGALGAKSAATPTLNDWSAVSDIKANTDLSNGARIALNQATFWKTTNPVNGLNALNSALDTFKGSDVDKTVLQKIVDSYGRILQEADGSRAIDTDVKYVDSQSGSGGGSDVTEQDLINVGVAHGGANGGNAVGTDTGLFYQKTGELLASCIGSLASSAVDTVSELNVLVGYAENVMKQAAGASVSYSDTQWVSALSGLGVAGVTATNIAAIKGAITTAQVAGTDSFDELQALVSLVRVNDFVKQNNGFATPTQADFQILCDENGGNYDDAKQGFLNAYNDALQHDADKSLTGAEVKGIVTAYNKILEEANGTALDSTAADPDATDFAAIGIKDAGNNNLSSSQAQLLCDIIAGKTTADVDTVQEINALAVIVNKLTKLSEVTNGVIDYANAPSRAELDAIGLSGNGNSIVYSVSDAELLYFYNHVLALDTTKQSEQLTSLAQLQNLMNQAIANA